MQLRLYPYSLAFRRSKDRVAGRAAARTACRGTELTMPNPFAVLCVPAKSFPGWHAVGEMARYRLVRIPTDFTNLSLPLILLGFIRAG